MRVLAILIALATLAPLAHAGTGPEARVECPGPTTTLPGAPARAHETPPTEIVREDPDGLSTLVTSIDPPFEGTYTYVATPRVPLSPVGTVPATTVAYTHVWAHERPLVTVGLVVDAVRVPLVVLEGTDAAAMALSVALDVALLAADGGASLLAGLINEPYPSPDAHAGTPPTFAWTTYRRAEGRELWTGFVLTRQASSNAAEGDAATCLRVELLSVVRTEAGTTPIGGAYVEASKLRTRDPGAESATFGIVAGATARGIDAPSAGTRATRLATDDGHYAGEVSLGAVDERGEYHPLVGVRQETSRGEAPEAYNALVALGAYRVDGAFVPVAGLRMHVERSDPLQWIGAFLGSGGPGNAVAGDWESDAGAFDPFGRFVPIAGAAYDDTLDEAGRAFSTGIRARHASQTLATAGVWALGAYRPVLGVTYDGTHPLLHSALGRPHEYRHLVSTGAFAPVAGYLPVVGAQTSYAQGEGERTTLGTFGGSYDVFVPLAATEWRSDRSLASWTLGTGVAGVPSEASLTAGPALSDEYVPVAGFEVRKRPNDEWSVLLAGERVELACIGVSCVPNDGEGSQ